MSDPTPQPNAVAGKKHSLYALRKENALGQAFHWILK
jgi:hypothetical protein